MNIYKLLLFISNVILTMLVN